MKQILSLIILVNFYNCSLAQQSVEKYRSPLKESAPLTFALQEVIHSIILGEDKTINICLPESFYDVSEQHTYPVLFLLENEFFEMVSGVVKHLSSVERMPETIVVSLSYDVPIPKLYTNGSDFWPKDWKQLPFGGDPDPFTAHLRQELKPHLKEEFRANDFSIVMGLSGSSIYALHTFIKEPDLFDKHIAIASGDILGMGYIEGESLIDLFVSDLKNLPDRKACLYVTSADADSDGSPMIKANLEELEERLSPYRSDDFQFISKIFINEGHYDVALPALEEALGLIFPKEKWSARYREIIKNPGNAMKNIDSYYQNLSLEYGFDILPRAERWNSVNRLSWIGPDLLKKGRVSEAIEVIERWVEYRPKSTLALSELAQAYEVNDELSKALLALEKAYKISTELGLDESQEYLTQISTLREKQIKNK